MLGSFAWAGTEEESTNYPKTKDVVAVAAAADISWLMKEESRERLLCRKQRQT